MCVCVCVTCVCVCMHTLIRIRASAHGCVCACIAGFASWGDNLSAVLKWKYPGVRDVSPICYYLTD